MYQAKDKPRCHAQLAAALNSMNIQRRLTEFTMMMITH